MSKPNFTPGPWTINGNIGRKSELGIVADSAPCIIAIMGNAKAWPVQAEANARLIAAAPALYDALMLALPYVETALEDEGYKPGVVNRMTQTIRDALALVDSPDAETGAEIASRL